MLSHQTAADKARDMAFTGRLQRFAISSVSYPRRCIHLRVFRI
jgi:hypothetical protein